MKYNCIVAQSGGPTAAINASLAGVCQGVIDSDMYDTILGSVNGIQGVINKKFLNLSELAAKDADFITKLKATPAMFLGSCRYRLPDYNKDNKIYEDIFKTFEENNIGAMFYIGGNDSMDTVDKLSAYAASIGSDIKIAGIPKTIDNDLVKTDHTPGFGSACKYLATSIREIAYDTFIYALPSVTIIEVMGRDAGWLTAASALARNDFSPAPHLIYLPELPFSTEKFIEDIKQVQKKYSNIIVAVSEGIKDENGEYISSTTAAADKFGHAQLSGTGKCLENLVKEKLGLKVRSIELNVLQRCAGHISSLTDLNESFELGKKAVSLTAEGKSGFMTTINRISDSPYQTTLSYAPVCEIANLAKDVPTEWISPDGNDVTEDMINYLKPLIQGEIENTFNDGVIEYLDISHLFHEI